MSSSFEKLLLTAVGANTSEFVLTEKEWQYCFEQALKQSLVGILFPVVQKYMRNEQGKRFEPLFSEWLGLIVRTDLYNKDLDGKAAMLSKILHSWGYKSCILKGQGIARLYPEPSLRQGGDIDIWVKGKQDDIINCFKDHCIGINHIHYVHSVITIFEDASVEAHFRPSWMYNPFSNCKLQTFFADNAEEQFEHVDEALGFAYPTVYFNLVYSLVHINRHIFDEGIGLRQILDYYYILKHSNKQERENAFIVLMNLNLKKFTGAIMYVLQDVFCLEDEWLLCAPNQKEGTFLLDEIMRGGNFGQYDDRNKWYEVNQRLKRGLFNAKRNMRYLVHYPSEVIWIPLWKVWHWCWRKKKGYL